MIDCAVLLLDHSRRNAAPTQIDSECKLDRAAVDDEYETSKSRMRGKSRFGTE